MTGMQTYVSQSIDRDAAVPFSEQHLVPLFDVEAELHPPSVLIADDDPNVAPLVVAALKPYRMEIESVTSGADALSRLREKNYNLLVLDLEMAGIHGLQVLERLRETPRYERIPVLVLTASASSEALARCFGGGADEFIRKPFDMREFGVRAFRLIHPFRE